MLRCCEVDRKAQSTSLEDYYLNCIVSISTTVEAGAIVVFVLGVDFNSISSLKTNLLTRR